MKLEPIAKPIRIRIKLGKSEYSNLDDVKKNFSINELYPLFKDGRLERWLRQNGEIRLANKSTSLSEYCGNGGLADYVLFMSLFFDSVSKSFTSYDDLLPIKKYLFAAPIEVIRDIYTYTKDLSEIDWKEHLADILTVDNVHTFFEDELLHTVYSDKKEWGSVFLDLAKTDNDYRRIFKYLEQKVGENSNFEIVFNNFYNLSKSRFKYIEAFKDELTFERAAYLFQNRAHLIFSIDWGEAFAEIYKHKNENLEKIEHVLQDDLYYLNSFYYHCGGELSKKADPWCIFANSDEFVYVSKAIKEYVGYKYEKENYNYDKMKSSFGKEILDSLQTIREIYYEDLDENKFLIDKTILKDELTFLIAVRKGMDSRYFDISARKMLKEMSQRGNLFAEYALTYENRSFSDKDYFIQYRDKVFNYILNRLNELRIKQ